MTAKLRETKISKHGKMNRKGNIFFKRKKNIKKYLYCTQRVKILVHPLNKNRML